MVSDIRRYFIGLASSFLGMVVICILIHPSIFQYYGYGISEFGAIHATLIPFFLGFTATVLFLTLIALRLKATDKVLSMVFALTAFCLGGVAVTSHPFTRFTYDLHWFFVILLTLIITVAVTWCLSVAKVGAIDLTLAGVFFVTTILSILPIVRDIPVFRDFILRELLAFIASFWFLGRVVRDRAKAAS